MQSSPFSGRPHQAGKLVSDLGLPMKYRPVNITGCARTATVYADYMQHIELFFPSSYAGSAARCGK